MQSSNSLPPNVYFYFQQDGTPTHFALTVRGLFDKWIVRRGAID